MEESPNFYTRENILLSGQSRKEPLYYESPLTLRQTNEVNKHGSYGEPPTVGKDDEHFQNRQIAHSKEFIFTTSHSQSNEDPFLQNLDDQEVAAFSARQYQTGVNEYEKPQSKSHNSALMQTNTSNTILSQTLFNGPPIKQISQQYNARDELFGKVQQPAEDYSPFGEQRSTDRNPLHSNSLSRQTSQDDLNLIYKHLQQNEKSGNLINPNLKLKRTQTCYIGDSSLRIAKQFNDNKKKLKIKSLTSQLNQERQEYNEKYQTFIIEYDKLKNNRDALLAQNQEKDQYIGSMSTQLQQLTTQLKKVEQEKYLLYLQFQNHQSLCSTPLRKHSEFSDQTKLESLAMDAKLQIAYFKQEIRQLKEELTNEVQKQSEISQLELTLLLNKIQGGSQIKPMHSHQRTQSNFKFDFQVNNSGSKKPSRRYENTAANDSLLESSKLIIQQEDFKNCGGEIFNVTLKHNEYGDYGVSKSKESDVTNKFNEGARTERGNSEEPSRLLFKNKTNIHQDQSTVEKSQKKIYRREMSILKMGKEAKYLEQESTERIKLKRKNSNIPSSLNTTRNLINCMEAGDMTEGELRKKRGHMMSAIEQELDKQLLLTDQSMQNCQITSKFSELSTQLSDTLNTNKLLSLKIKELQRENAEYKPKFDHIKVQYESLLKINHQQENEIELLKKKLEFSDLQQEMRANSIGETDNERNQRVMRLLNKIEQSQQYQEIFRVIKFTLNNKELTSIEMQKKIIELQNQIQKLKQQSPMNIKSGFTLEQVREMIRKNNEQDQKFIQESIMNKKSTVMQLQQQVLSQKFRVNMVMLGFMVSLFLFIAFSFYSQDTYLPYIHYRKC